MLKVGVIGYGYWGPNIVRNFYQTPGSTVTMVCDLDPKSLEKVKKQYPEITVTKDYQDIINSKNVDIVAVITPVHTHFKLSKAALEAGKHIFVEKPFTASSAEAIELIELAEKKNLKIMVDHTFLFTPAVRRIKAMVETGELGDLIYYDSTRVNLGLIQDDINVIWDLGPHDFSIMDFVIPNKVKSVSASAVAHFGRNQQEVAYVTTYLENDLIGHFSFNWLSPVKIRKTLVGGRRKKLVWDDLSVDEKIKVYDRGVHFNSEESRKLLVEYREGDMYCPKLEMKEALALETKYFVDCILNDQPILNDGHQGLRIVKMLEATDLSLRNEGRIIDV